MAFHQEADDKGGMRSRVNARSVGAVLIAAAVLAFVLQNRASTSLDWLMFSFTAPLWIILLGTTVAGILIGVLLTRHRAKGKSR